MGPINGRTKFNVFGNQAPRDDATTTQSFRTFPARKPKGRPSKQRSSEDWNGHASRAPEIVLPAAAQAADAAFRRVWTKAGASVLYLAMEHLPAQHGNLQMEELLRGAKQLLYNELGEDAEIMKPYLQSAVFENKDLDPLIGIEMSGVYHEERGVMMSNAMYGKEHRERCLALGLAAAKAAAKDWTQWDGRPLFQRIVKIAQSEPTEHQKLDRPVLPRNRVKAEPSETPPAVEPGSAYEEDDAEPEIEDGPDDVLASVATSSQDPQAELASFRQQASVQDALEQAHEKLRKAEEVLRKQKEDLEEQVEDTRLALQMQQAAAKNAEEEMEATKRAAKEAARASREEMEATKKAAEEAARASREEMEATKGAAAEAARASKKELEELKAAKMAKEKEFLEEVEGLKQFQQLLAQQQEELKMRDEASKSAIAKFQAQLQERNLANAALEQEKQKLQESQKRLQNDLNLKQQEIVAKEGLLLHEISQKEKLKQEVAKESAMKKEELEKLKEEVRTALSEASSAKERAARLEADLKKAAEELQEARAQVSEVAKQDDKVKEIREQAAACAKSSQASWDRLLALFGTEESKAIAETPAPEAPEEPAAQKMLPDSQAEEAPPWKRPAPAKAGQPKGEARQLPRPKPPRSGLVVTKASMTKPALPKPMPKQTSKPLPSPLVQVISHKPGPGKPAAAKSGVKRKKTQQEVQDVDLSDAVTEPPSPSGPAEAAAR